MITVDIKSLLNFLNSHHALNIDALIEIFHEKCQQLSKRLFNNQHLHITVADEVHPLIAVCDNEYPVTEA